MNKIKLLSRAEVRQHLQPYAEEIGQVTLAWSHLQENLCLLFWLAIGQGPVPYAIWDRLSNDRTQRDILKTAVEAGAFVRIGARLTDDVLWLLKETERLAEHRNVAIHAPLITLTDVATGITRVEAETFFGNRRAKSLKGKDIMRELAWCAECADALSRFAANLVQEMNASPLSWPERPSLPARPTQNTSPRNHKRARSSSK
jgi:hypothetical protein